MKKGEPFSPWGTVNPWIAIMRRKDLTDGAKLAWCRLAFFSGKSGFCNPSMSRLAIEIGRVDPRRARSAVAELERHKLIRREVGGGADTNAFVFLWQPEFETLLFPDLPRTQLSGVDPGRKRPPRTQMVVDPGRMRPPNASLNTTRRVASQKTRRVTAKSKPFQCEHTPKCSNRLWHVCTEIDRAAGSPGGQYTKVELKQAKALADVPDEEIRATVRFMIETNGAWWATKPINPASVKKHLKVYRRNQAAADEAGDRYPMFKGDRA